MERKERHEMRSKDAGEKEEGEWEGRKGMRKGRKELGRKESDGGREKRIFA